MKKRSFKKWLFEKHHFLILIIIFLALLTAAILTNTENLGISLNEIFSSDKDISQENSLEEKSPYVPTNPAPNPNPVPKTSPPIVQNPVVKEIKPVDYSNFILTVLANEMISDLPKSGSISLNTFNFNTGERQIEKTYLLTKGSVVESSAPADIYVNFHSKYVEQVTSTNLCEILTLANNNGDFGAWTDLETSSLMWTYKGMLKYRDCLGF